MSREDASLSEAKQRLERAYAFEDQGEYIRALEECNAIIEIEPGFAEVHNLRGIILEELGREDEAVSAYRKALHLAPEFADAKENLADLEAELRKKTKPSIGRIDFWEWFGSYWYFFLFPTFVFSAGIRLGITTCNPGTIGFVATVALAYWLKQAKIESVKRLAIITFVVPLVFAAFALLVVFFVPFSAGEIRNPYLDMTARLGRVFMSAMFSMLLLLGSVGLIKLTRR